MESDPRIRPQEAKRDQIQPGDHPAHPAHDSEPRLRHPSQIRLAEKPSEQNDKAPPAVLWLKDEDLGPPPLPDEQELLPDRAPLLLYRALRPLPGGTRRPSQPGHGAASRAGRTSEESEAVVGERIVRS